MAIPATQSNVAAPRRGPRWGLQRSEHRALLVGGDVAALCIGVAISLWTWSITAGVSFTWAFVQERAAWFLTVPIWTLALAPSYDLRTALVVPGTVRALAPAVVVLLAAYLAVYFYAPRYELPRLVALYVLWEGALLTLGWRLVYIWFVTHLPLDKHLLILGASEAGRTTLGLLRTADPHATVVGFVDDDQQLWGSEVDGVPVLGGADCLADAVARHAVGEVVVAVPHRAGSALLGALADCLHQGVDVVPMSQVYETHLRRVPVSYLESGWLFSSFVEVVRRKDASRVAKRVLDLVGATAGLVTLAALTLIIAPTIWLESGRPIFFRQGRLGRGGAPFDLIKFRTMVQDAEADGPPQWASRQDPRVTLVGRFLRRTRLDELPNFVNVLRGEMSLVGPRPERPEFVAQLEREIPFYRTRLLIRPGLTGWAQVNHPYGDSVRGALEKLEYDLYYVKHRSLFFDLWIVVRTVGTVLALRGR